MTTPSAAGGHGDREGDKASKGLLTRLLEKLSEEEFEYDTSGQGSEFDYDSPSGYSGASDHQAAQPASSNHAAQPASSNHAAQPAPGHEPAQPAPQPMYAASAPQPAAAPQTAAQAEPGPTDLASSSTPFGHESVPAFALDGSSGDAAGTSVPAEEAPMQPAQPMPAQPAPAAPQSFQVDPSFQAAPASPEAPYETGAAATPPPPAQPSSPADGFAANDLEALQSSNPVRRRQALADLRGHALTRTQMTQLADLLLDPDVEIRVATLELLATQGSMLDLSMLIQPLGDPDDHVRAAALRALATRPEHGIDLAIPHIANRSFPLSQLAAFEVLAKAVAEQPPSHEQLSSLLRHLGSMPSGPGRTERGGFASLASAIGDDRLASMVSAEAPVAIGATRLLLQRETPAALRAVATLDAHRSDELRHSARIARDRLQALSRGGFDAPAGPESASPAPASGVEVARSFVPRLAQAMHDPDERVRTGALAALNSAKRESVAAWCREALRRGPLAEASMAANVAEHLSLTEVAADLLERAADSPAEQRGAMYGALQAFALEPAFLADLLQNVEASRKPSAIEIVWNVGGLAVIPYLKTLLSDASGSVRMAVLELMADVGDPDAVDTAISVVTNDSSPQVRSSALKLLEKSDAAHRLRALQVASRDSDDDVRATATDVLLPGLAAEHFDQVLAALNDPSASVWSVAIRHIAETASPDDARAWKALQSCTPSQRDEFISVLEMVSPTRLAAFARHGLASFDPVDRQIGVELAGRSGTPEMVRRIIDMLDDTSPDVRHAATSRLRQLRTPEAVDALAQALSDPDVRVRSEAIQALGDIDHDEVIPAIVGALKDPVSRVRDLAAEVLGSWKSPKVAAQLISRLGQAEHESAVAELLVRMGPQAVDPIVDEVIKHPFERTVMLGRVLDQLVGAEPFVEQLSIRDVAVRLRAVDALGAIHSHASTVGLIKALDDPNDEVRLHAVLHLAQRSGPQPADAIRRVADGDPVERVANAAREALDNQA